MKPACSKLSANITHHHPVLEMINISKRFGRIQALDHVNLTIWPHEIVAIVGENGAGKSTLMSILFGIYSPDQGDIKINHHPVVIKNTHQARSSFIGLLSQHFELVNNLEVWKNIALGREQAWFFLPSKKIKNQIRALCLRYHLKINLDAKLGDLCYSDHQKVELLKNLFWDSQIFIFDEPTSVLDEQDTHQFFKVMAALVKNKKTVIWIAHNLDHVFQVADRIVVMTKGRVVLEKPLVAVTKAAIVNKMFPQIKLQSEKNLKTTRFLGDYQTQPVLSFQAVSYSPYLLGRNFTLQNVSFDVHPGQIVGVAGIAGNGQQEVFDLIIGTKHPSSGQVLFKNQKINPYSVAWRNRNLAIAKIPDDRERQGLIMNSTVFNNTVLPFIGRYPFSRWGIIRRRYNKYWTQKMIAKYGIKNAQAGFGLVGNMSGGNQQKTIIAREMSMSRELLVFKQPTRGLDLVTSRLVYDQIRTAARQNVGVLVFSSELHELVSLCHTVLVIDRGQIKAILKQKQVTYQNISNAIVKASHYGH